MEAVLPFLLPLLALVCLWRSHVTNRKRRLVQTLPTSKTQGVFIGMVELTGTAECESPVRTFLAEIPAVHYSYNVSEHWSRTVVESYKDSEGKTQTRTRTESGWSTVASGGQTVPFYLCDDTGAVLVWAEGAELRPRTVFKEVCGPSHPLYYDKGPNGSVMDSTHRRSFTETAIPLHQQIFAIGKARERQDMVAPELAHDPEAPLYLLTVENEAQVLRRMGWSLHLLNILGLVLAGAAGYFIAQEPGIFFGVGIYTVLWLFTWLLLVFNNLVDAKNRVRQGWSALEVQFQRRHDLIPPLVEMAKGAAAHESSLQSHLALLRSQAAITAFEPSTLHPTAPSILAIAESYPQITSDENFRQLQAQLIETEQRIALARSYFNEIATTYNTRLEVFPEGFLAKLFGFRAQPLLFAQEFERARIQVHFAQ